VSPATAETRPLLTGHYLVPGKDIILPGRR
jgi:hypothetical protein